MKLNLTLRLLGRGLGGERPELLTPAAPPGPERGDWCPGSGRGGADAVGRRPRGARRRRPARPSPAGRLLGVGPAARYAEPPGGARRRARPWGPRVRAGRGETGVALCLAALGRCTWRDVSEGGLFFFREVVTD